MRATWACLEQQTRRNIAISAAAAAVLAAFDAIAIGLLPNLIDRFQTDDPQHGGVSLLAMSTVIATLLIAKSFASVMLVRWEASFFAAGESERTIGLFRHLLHLPYGDTAHTSTGEYVRDLHIAVPALYRNAAAGMARLVADGLSIVGLVIAVIVSSPVTGAVLVVFFMGAGQLYSRLIRARANRISRLFHDGNRACLVDLQETFGGLKTVKAFSIEDMAVDRFARTRSRFARSVRGLILYGQLSRVYMEIVLVVGLGTSLGAVYLVSGRAAVLTVFGLLAGAAARAMPALTRLLNRITVIKLNGESVLRLQPLLRHLEEDSAAGTSTVPAAEASRGSDRAGIASLDGGRLVALERVRFRYPGAADDALHGVSLDLGPGELVAILGGSGMGKTTLVDLLIGLLSPQQGTVRRVAGGSVGYVAQDTFVWDDTIRFNVAVGRPPVGSDVETAIWDALEAAQLANWVRTLPGGLDERLGERGNRMSGGQRQRLGLARALYGHPAILVLDEPTSALDGDTSRALLNTLVALKSTVGIVVVTHDPIVMNFSDRTLTLEASARR